MDVVLKENGKETKVKSMKGSGCNKENNKAVAILLSTYNGSGYIEKQLESIANQTYENITLFIRDDGSSDGTAVLTEQFIRKNDLENKMVVLKDCEGNLGYGGSFYKLANTVKGFAYYFFCDQDDYWLPDKVERAVRLLEQEPDQELVCYMSNYYISDDSLEIKRKAYGHKLALETETLGRQAFEMTLVVGMAAAINEALRKVCFELPDGKGVPFSHDKWIALVLTGLNGKLIYDVVPTAIRRRHKSTTSAGDQMFIFKLLWRINHVLKGDYLWQIRQMITLYKECYFKQIYSRNEKNFLRVFTRNDIAGYFEKIFYPHRLRKKIMDEVLLRILFMIGKYDIKSMKLGG